MLKATIQQRERPALVIGLAGPMGGGGSIRFVLEFSPGLLADRGKPKKRPTGPTDDRRACPGRPPCWGDRGFDFDAAVFGAAGLGPCHRGLRELMAPLVARGWAPDFGCMLWPASGLAEFALGTGLDAGLAATARLPTDGGGWPCG